MIIISLPTIRVPIGVMMIWSTDIAPKDWLLCYGQAISRTTYARLFEVVGTTYGVGDGSTTFNIPDFRGRISLGKDNMGGVSANRITNAQADTIGGSSGAENHTLTVAQLATHTHPIGVWKDTGGIGDEHLYHFQGTQLDTNYTNSTGSNSAHNNVQPYLTNNYIIKYQN